MRRTALILLLAALSPSSSEAQDNRLSPNFYGHAAEVLAGARTPDVCFVTEPGWTGPGTLADCIGREGFRLILCRLPSAGPSYAQMHIRNDSVAVAGMSCPSGAWDVQTLSHAVTGGSTSIDIRADHVILSNIRGWDQECAAEPAGVCTFEEQKQLRIYGNWIMILESWFAGNSGDDVGGVCANPFECELITIFETVFGPVKKYIEPDGRSGEGQCLPIAATASKVSLIRVVGAQCGHRGHILGGDELYLQDGISAGWGGRNFELNADGDRTRAWVNGWVWMGNVPPVSRQNTMMLRFHLEDDGADQMRAGLHKVFLERIRGDGSLGGPFEEEWAGRTGFLARTHCTRSNYGAFDCPEPYEDITPSMWLADAPELEAPAFLPPELDIVRRAVIDERIGPRFRLACDGTVASSSNLRPFHRRILRNLREGTHPGGPNRGWPITMDAYYEPYPDVDRSGELCDDSDLDGVWDLTEARVDRARGGDGCTTCVELGDDSDLDGRPLWVEVYFARTDPTVNDSELPGPGPIEPPPGGDEELVTSCELTESPGVYLVTLTVEGEVVGRLVIESAVPLPECGSRTPSG